MPILAPYGQEHQPFKRSRRQPTTKPRRHSSTESRQSPYQSHDAARRVSAKQCRPPKRYRRVNVSRQQITVAEQLQPALSDGQYQIYCIFVGRFASVTRLPKLQQHTTRYPAVTTRILITNYRPVPAYSAYAKDAAVFFRFSNNYHISLNPDGTPYEVTALKPDQ